MPESNRPGPPQLFIAQQQCIKALIFIICLGLFGFVLCFLPRVGINSLSLNCTDDARHKRRDGETYIKGLLVLMLAKLYHKHSIYFLWLLFFLFASPLLFNLSLSLLFSFVFSSQQKARTTARRLSSQRLLIY